MSILKISTGSIANSSWQSILFLSFEEKISWVWFIVLEFGTDMIVEVSINKLHSYNTNKIARDMIQSLYSKRKVIGK